MAAIGSIPSKNADASRTKFCATQNRRLMMMISMNGLTEASFFSLSGTKWQLEDQCHQNTIAHFAEKYGARFGRKISRIDRQTFHILQSHSWPGNVRELENVMERAVILSRGGVLHLDTAMLFTTKGNSAPQVRSEERQAIEAALTASRGRVAGEGGAAKKLGVPASTLEFRIKRLGIDKFRYRQH